MMRPVDEAEETLADRSADALSGVAGMPHTVSREEREGP